MKGKPEAGPSPPLKWAGGKRWLAPSLKDIWDFLGDREALVEPFAGSLAVSLFIRPPRAILNDYNATLVGLYKEIQNSPEPWDMEEVEVSSAVGRLKTRDVTESLYYSARAEFNRMWLGWSSPSPSMIPEIPPFLVGEPSTPHPRRREERLGLLWSSAEVPPQPLLAFRAKLVRLFYFVLRTGFNGLCRFGRRGFNVPFGRRPNPTLLLDRSHAAEYRKYHALLSPWSFSSSDFGVFLDVSMEGGGKKFVYMDPPYDTPFTKYSSANFGQGEQERLVGDILRLAIRFEESAFVLSNQFTEFTSDLYIAGGAPAGLVGALLERGYPEEKIGAFRMQAPRRIAANGNRAPAEEFLLVIGAPRESVTKILKDRLPTTRKWGKGGWS